MPRPPQQPPADASTFAGQDAVGAAYRAARARFGEFGVSATAFAERVAQILAGAAGQVRRPEELALEDLYLALGCQAGDARAWRTLDGSLRSYLRRQCVRAAGSESAGDELLGDLYADLVGRPQAAGKIELYRGLASLATWLAVVIRRMALDRARLVERRGVSEELEPERQAAPEHETPEARLARAEGAELSRRILRDALAQLEARHRLVLRLVYEDGLTLREAGVVLGVDFSTVSRRLKTAREAARKTVKQVSRQAYGLPAEALAGLLEQIGEPGEASPLEQGET